MFKIQALIVSVIMAVLPAACFAEDSGRPNVLLIAIDDLNDWIGSMGGHPQAKTPNMDRLAARGVLFNNAHCQSPVCNPSRASMMTSLYPSTTGIYFLSPDLSASPVAVKNTLLPKRFQNEGYYVTGAGKIFHGNQNKKYLPNWAGSFTGIRTKDICPITEEVSAGWGRIPKRNSVRFPDTRCGTGAFFPSVTTK